MLTKKVSSFFASGVRARGESYAADDLVARVRVEKDRVRGIVMGSRDYDVSVRRRDRLHGWDLEASCTCPYMDDRGELCKHVWALLKDAEGRVEAKWGMPPKSVSIGVWFSDEDESDEDSGDESGAEEETGAGVGEAGEHDLQVVGTSPDGSKTTVRLGKNGPLIVMSSGLMGRLIKKPVIGRAGEPARARTPAKPRVALWKRMLEETRPHAWGGGGWGSGGAKKEGPIVENIWYVIDGERSKANGAIVIDLVRGGTGGDGLPGKLVKLTIAAGDVGRIRNAEDRAICALLVGAARPGREYGAYQDYSYRSASGQRAALWRLEPRMLRVAMEMMDATGRLAWRRDDRGVVERARWSGDAPWELAIELHADAGKGRGADSGALLRPVVRRGEERVGLGHVLATEGDPGAVLHAGEVSPLRVAGGENGGMLAWARSVWHRPPVMVGREELAGLLDALEDKKIGLPVIWPETWGVARLAGAGPRSRPGLSREREDGRSASPDRLLADVGFEYEGTRVGAETGRYVPVTRTDGARAMVERDVDLERRAVERFLELGGKRDGYHGLHVPVKRVPTVAAGLLGEGWEVVGEQAAYRRPGAVDVRVKSGIDWFDLEGGVEFGDGGGSATIGAVIAALRKGERFVALGDGSLGLLPEEWLARHGKWLGLGREEGGAVRFGRAQLTLVDALLAEMPEATCDKQTAAARAKLRAFEGIVARVEPKGFRGQLRPYQRQGLGWLHFLAEFGLGGCLADDMGLGKTVQLLAHMADRRKAGDEGPWLVVAPKSLVFNWAREAERFTPGLRIVAHTGPERGSSEEGLERADLVLTTYATMRLDIELLRRVEFACVVLDEAQGIKNAGSQAAKAARLLRGRRRLALTGTPVENRLEDLWSIFEFLNPGMLGTSKGFGEALGRGNGTAGTEEGRAGMEVLRRALRPFLLRRTKAVVAPELPARSEQTVRCELEGRQKALYEGLRMHYRERLLGRVEREGMNKSKMHVLEALLRLRQAACHPGLVEVKDAPAARGGKGGPKSGAKGADSAKMETLVEMLEELATEGHKALVFSQFTSLLALVRAELDRRKIGYEELDGTTSAGEREIRVDRFQRVGVKEGGKGVFLISLKAGGVGLNLTAAGYVFLLDPWWNPAVEAQAIDRTHRIGQDKSVMAYRLIASGTVEERILELQERKRELAAAIVSENAGPLSGMTREDLEWLLS
ncbi:MAG TPA: DEAD/DEAH box helicase [Phycisphaerales bacterium]|nr:DEAD/DEAH box helicase [Phycisphaerales bacterium]